MEEKKRVKRIFKIFTIPSLIVLLLILIVPTFGWFIYNRVIDANIEARVKAWDIGLTGADDNEITFIISDQLYPGMNDIQETAEITNNGELGARVSTSISEITLFGVNYKLGTGVGEYTQAELQALLDSWPIDVDIQFGEEIINQGSMANLTLRISWPYENPACSGQADVTPCDALDTEWGTKSYEYKRSNPNKPSIIIKAAIKAEQIEE